MVFPNGKKNNTFNTLIIFILPPPLVGSDLLGGDVHFSMCRRRNFLARPPTTSPVGSDHLPVGGLGRGVIICWGGGGGNTYFQFWVPGLKPYSGTRVPKRLHAWALTIKKYLSLSPEKALAGRSHLSCRTSTSSTRTSPMPGWPASTTAWERGTPRCGTDRELLKGCQQNPKYICFFFKKNITTVYLYIIIIDMYI